jgi:5'-3' exonuclease
MGKKEYLEMLNKIEQGSDSPQLNRHDRVLVIDGLNLFLRNFAVLNFVNEEGTHIGGLAGFLRSLGSLIKQIQPTSVYIIFDGVGSSTNRKNLLPEYKSGRNVRITNWDIFENLDDEHDSKIDQIVRLIQYLKCLPVKVISINKSEADDVISHLSTTLDKEYNSRVVIVSSDKDFLQLVNNNITVYRPIERDFYDIKTVIEKFGVPPHNFIFYKTLVGDTSDKISGVKGVGNKGVLKKFPELAGDRLELQDIYDLSVERLKEGVVYARILHDWTSVENHYKIMDLGNPLLDDNEKEFIDNKIKEKVASLRVLDFLTLYNEDGLNHIIKNTEFWVKDTFSNLKIYDA